MDIQILNILKECPLFHGMAENEINAALDMVSYRIVHLDKNNLFAITGDAYTFANIVLKGEMKAQMGTASGKFVEVTTLRKGNVIAPAFIFAKNNALPVTVETKTSVDILRMTTLEFRNLIDCNERIRWNFIVLLSNINVFLTSKLKVLSLMSVREKIGTMLLQLAKEQQSRTITLKLSRQEIANKFGIQKFSVTRQLAAFQEEGAISIEGKKITILKPGQLRS